MRAQLRGWLLATALLPACAYFGGSPNGTVHWVEGPLPCTSGDKWRTISSEHFVVYTDRSASVARDTTIDLERVFRAFSDLPLLGPPMTTPPPGRITVVIFGSREDYQRLYPDPRYAGRSTLVRNQIEPLPLIVFKQELGEDGKEILVHELSHRFVYHAAPGAPRWLVEGLADYDSTLELTHGEARVGELPRNFFHFNRYFLSRKEILAAKDDDVYDFYAGAFALVHLLNDTPARQAAFHQFHSLLADGIAADEAMRRALGGIDWTTIDKDLVAYLPQISYVLQKAPYQPRPVELSPLRTVGHAELHRLWASIRVWTKDNAPLVERDLTEAESLEPDAVETRILRVAYLAGGGKADAVLARLEPLMAARPDDLQLRVLHAWALWYRDRAPSSPDRERVLSELQAIMAAAKTPGVLGNTARLFAAHDRPAEALSASDIALRMTPGDESLHEVRAWALHGLVRDREAARELSLAIGLRAHGQDTRRLRAKLAEYQKAAEGAAVHVDDAP